MFLIEGVSTGGYLQIDMNKGRKYICIRENNCYLLFLASKAAILLTFLSI